MRLHVPALVARILAMIVVDLVRMPLPEQSTRGALLRQKRLIRITTSGLDGRPRQRRRVFGCPVHIPMFDNSVTCQQRTGTEFSRDREFLSETAKMPEDMRNRGELGFGRYGTRYGGLFEASRARPRAKFSQPFRHMRAISMACAGFSFTSYERAAVSRAYRSVCRDRCVTKHAAQDGCFALCVCAWCRVSIRGLACSWRGAGKGDIRRWRVAMVRSVSRASVSSIYR